MEANVIIVLGLLVLAYAAVSKPLSRTPFTAPLAFTLVGVAVSVDGWGWLELTPSAGTLEKVAEVTLVAVLFADASRMDPRDLRREAAIPLRLLGIGLPLTIGLGVLAGLTVLPALTMAEALVLAIILAPTDAALGAAVVSDERLPTKIRLSLNTESGLNDGICVPLLAVALTIVDVADDGAEASKVVPELVSQLTWGLVTGLVAGLVGGLVLREASRRRWIEPAWRPVMAVATAALAYGLALAAGASGFVAAFVAGVAFRVVVGRETPEEVLLPEELSEILSTVTFVLFGAAILGPQLADIDLRTIAYAVLSLTVVRMVPVALALVGSGLPRPAVALMGWFGPRGLASIVFAVIAVEEVALPHSPLVVEVATVTIALSILLHGATANPMVGRYAAWDARRTPTEP